MKVDSLDALKKEFRLWRSKKRHVREQIPEALWVRAQRAVSVHGLNQVARATKLDRARLTARAKANGSMDRDVSVPSFTRLELTAPSAMASPIAEVEMPTGVKIRVFAQTQETLGWLSSLCGVGGAP